MRKRIMMFMLCSLLLVFMAACSNGSNGDTNKTVDNESGNAMPENTPAPADSTESQKDEPVAEEKSEPPAPEKEQPLTTKAVQGTPVIDGKIDDIWGTANIITTDRWAGGSSGSTAKVRMLWDEGHIYVLAEVTDKLLTKKSANVWEQDSVEVFIDQNNGKTSTYEPDDGQYRINFDNEASVSPGTLAGNLVSAAQKMDYGYIVEASIAWNGTPPKLGDIIGFDFQVNNDENDDGVRDSVAIWNDTTGQSYQNTSGIGLLELVGEGPRTTTAVQGKPAIDGKIDDIWSKANTISTDRWVQGSSGSTAKVRTLWDDGYIYVLAEVTDKLLTKKSANVWEQDSAEIFIDQNNGKTSTYEADDGQYRINFDNEASVNPGTLAGNLVSAVQKTKDGYIVEASIAWTGTAPKAGDIIGFDFQVNNDENDDGVRDSVAIWNDTTGQSYQNTSALGLLILGGTK